MSRVRELYRAYHPRLTRFLMTMTRRPPLVEEVLNDTMMVVWNRPERSMQQQALDLDLRHRLSDRSGRPRRQDQPLEDKGPTRGPIPNGVPELQLGDRQVQAVLLSALDDLSSDHRAVVDLTYFHDMGYREIARSWTVPSTR